MIGGRAKAIGFSLTMNAVVDQELNQQVQISTNAPEGADWLALATLIATMRDACWAERVAANERLLLLNERLKVIRKRRIDEARTAGKEIDEDSLREEDSRIAASTLKLESQLEADRAVQRELGGVVHAPPGKPCLSTPLRAV